MVKSPTLDSTVYCLHCTSPAKSELKRKTLSHHLKTNHALIHQQRMWNGYCRPVEQLDFSFYSKEELLERRQREE